jgi:hypothetical protein
MQLVDSNFSPFEVDLILYVVRINNPSRPNDPASKATTNSSGNSKNATVNESPLVVEKSNPKCKGFVKAIFLIINLGLMIMMSATGALGIKNSSSITDSSTIIVGLYMILFSGMLATFEIIQIYPCSLIDILYKKNFGFLYGLMGKSGFTVFMAVLSFGIPDPAQLAVATGKNGSTL